MPLAAIRHIGVDGDADEEDHIIEALPNYDNVFVTEGKMNRGWEEVIRYLFN